MKLEEKHPEIQGYIKEMEEILKKSNHPLLPEFLNMIEKYDIFDFTLQIYDLKDAGKLPPEIDKPLTNLYGAIR